MYRFKDHLGNNRLSYTDANNDGNIAQNEIVKESNYYPFGLKHKGYNSTENTLGNIFAKNFMFGGKEYQEEFDINWCDVTARNYDPALGRWMNLDPLAEQMRRHSPYNFGFDNPIYYQDYDGMAPSGCCGPPAPGLRIGFKLLEGIESVTNFARDVANLPPIYITGNAKNSRGRRLSKRGDTDFRSKTGGNEGDSTEGPVDNHVQGDEILNAAPGSPNGSKPGPQGDRKTRS